MKRILIAMAAVFLTAFSYPDDIVIIDNCDYVEINYVYNIDDETGKANLRMIQYIWWEWRNRLLLPERDELGKETGNWFSGSGFAVREYLVVHSGNSRPNKVADVALSRDTDGWTCIFWDKDGRIFRRVKCKWLTTTHTNYDVEIENRDVVRLESRNKFKRGR